MKRDFLKNLGIEDKDIIDKILDENSSDIGRAKGELETYKNKVTDLEGKVSTQENEIKSLKEKSDNIDALNDKITQLETDKTNLTNELNTKVAQIQKTHAIENGVRDAKAKNVKAVMALLNMEKITYKEDKLEGLSDQLTALQSGESTSFLFGDTKPAPAGTNLSNPPAGGGNPPSAKSFAEAVANALSRNK